MLINLTGEKMNHLIKFLALTIILHNASCYGTMTTATITQEIITSSSITMSNLYIVSDIQPYTNGGLIFIYPPGLFTAPPRVTISVQPNISHSTTQAYTTEINSNNATGTTIMVYVINSGIVSEAPNGSVLVHLFAVADPS
jgi:hypothetical protein